MEKDGKGIQHMQRMQRMESLAISWDHRKWYGGDAGTGFMRTKTRGEAGRRQRPHLGLCVGGLLYHSRESGLCTMESPEDC